MCPFEITCLDPLQLRERAQVCPWRVGFELGPSHKSRCGLGHGVRGIQVYRFDRGSSNIINNIYISFSDWILIRDQWGKGLPTSL